MISEKILKESRPKVVKMLAIIFNAVLRIKYFPVSWKTARHNITKTKKKKKTIVADMLLPLISKLLEKIILIRMRKVINRKKFNSVSPV
jgi:hypothetical protein